MVLVRPIWLSSATFMPKSHSDIGLIGLAVMGQNLALNIADHGFQISVFNRTTEKTEKFVAENPNTPGGLVGTKTLPEFVQSLAKPRKSASRGLAREVAQRSGCLLSRTSQSANRGAARAVSGADRD